MPDLSSPAAVWEILRRHGFHFTKSLGQNFLADAHILQKIVQAAELCPSDQVVEIGPGMGTLTQALSESAASVTAVEIDRTLIPVLQETLSAYPNVQVINEDILKVDLQKLRGESTGALKVVANLPYYITTAIIMRLLESGFPASLMVFMIQKEVARRIDAQPGGKEYGSLSVAVQYYCHTDIALIAPRGAFVPAPAVDSAVIRLRRRAQPPVSLRSEALFFQVVRGAFSKRRKTLLNALSQYNGLWSKERIESALQASGIDPNRRGETLSIEEFASLANAIYATSSAPLSK